MAELISTLADVSTLWLVFLSFLFCLIPLAIVGGIVYGMHKLLNFLPPIFKRGQEMTAMIANKTDDFSQNVSAPFIAASAFASQLKGMVRGLYQIIRREA